MLNGELGRMGVGVEMVNGVKRVAAAADCTQGGGHTVGHRCVWETVHLRLYIMSLTNVTRNLT